MRKTCEACGSISNLTKHHVLPRSLGGTIADGVATVCRCCHDLIHWKGTPFEEIKDDRYVGIIANYASRFVIEQYRLFIAQATEWHQSGVLAEMLGIDLKAPRNARRRQRYLN